MDIETNNSPSSIPKTKSSGASSVCVHRVKHDYSKLTVKEIVDKIINLPYDEDAAVYLIQTKYDPLCHSVYLRTLANDLSFSDFQNELFLHLKGKKLDWQPLRSFRWKGTFGSWLGKTAYYLSIDLKNKWLQNGNYVSLGNGGVTIGGPTVDGEKVIERRNRLVLLHEAILKLDNSDQRFVVVRRMKGYTSKEIAEKLQNYWKQKGIIRYNNKNERIIPDSGYIDNLFKRGFDKVSKIFKTLDV